MFVCVRVCVCVCARERDREREEETEINNERREIQLARELESQNNMTLREHGDIIKRERVRERERASELER